MWEPGSSGSFLVLVAGPANVRNSNRPAVDFRYMPAIIEFLGYNPLPPATNWAERLVRHTAPGTVVMLKLSRCTSDQPRSQVEFGHSQVLSLLQTVQ